MVEVHSRVVMIQALDPDSESDFQLFGDSEIYQSLVPKRLGSDSQDQNFA